MSILILQELSPNASAATAIKVKNFFIIQCNYAAKILKKRFPFHSKLSLYLRYYANITARRAFAIHLVRQSFRGYRCPWPYFPRGLRAIRHDSTGPGHPPKCRRLGWLQRLSLFRQSYLRIQPHPPQRYWLRRLVRHTHHSRQRPLPLFPLPREGGAWIL